MRVVLRRIRGRKRHPNWQGIIKEVEKTLDDVIKPRLLEYPEKITADWDHKPNFGAKKSTKGGISVYVFPKGPNKKYWIWNSRGTKRHKIKPKKKDGVLAFPSSHTPRTSPQGPSYGKNKSSGGPTVFSKEVDHPGTRPRHFEEAWGRWAKSWFRREIENAMKRGARKA